VLVVEETVSGLEVINVLPLGVAAGADDVAAVAPVVPPGALPLSIRNQFVPLEMSIASP
jgi:hypothetical protein